MSRPNRNASPGDIVRTRRTFFTTTKTSLGRNLLQSDRNARLLIDVPRDLVTEKKFELHDFVIMPNHIHLLMTVHDGMTIEKAMQFVKGRFSFRMSKEVGFRGEIWQRGFSEVQVLDGNSFEQHRAYIAANPVRAGFVETAEHYPYCFRFLVAEKRRTGAKAHSLHEPSRHD